MKHFNKKGININFSLGNKAQELSFNTTCWSYLCKLIKPITQNLAENEYFKFKWMGTTVVFWRINNTIYKEMI